MTSTDPDDVVRAIGHLVTGDDAALCPTTKPGELLASLSWSDARRFALAAEDLAHDLYLAVVGEDGTLRLEAVGEDNHITNQERAQQ